MIHHPVAHHVGGLLLLGLGLRLIFLVAAVALVVLVALALARRRPGVHSDPALAKLRERLAAGEINPEEYEKLRTTLQA
jgi:uncharacterized membrane protein